mgnify:CR=1 FL=1
MFKEGDVALLGKSEKDADDARFDRAQSYAERKNPGVKVDSVITPLFAGGVSGTKMRQFLSLGEKGKTDFLKNVPAFISVSSKRIYAPLRGRDCQISSQDLYIKIFEANFF